MESFATSGDLTDRYPISFEDDTDAENRADNLLSDASAILRSKIKGIELRTDLEERLIVSVVCEMVWAAILPGATAGATQQTQSLNGVSVSTTFEGAAGRLRLSKAQFDLLKPDSTEGRASSTSSWPAHAQRTYVHTAPYEMNDSPWGNY